MRAAGASEVEIIPEPRAAALGAAVDISSHYAQMIVDVGEGVTDCAILRTGGILVSSAARIGCADLREQLRQGFLASERINITSAEAARILMRVGVDGSDGVDEPVTINGSRSDVAAPVRVVVTQAAIWAMLEPVVGRMVATAADFLHSAPHDLGCEIIESGIVLTGGGSLVPGMGKRLAAATAIEVKTPPDALGVVLLGLRAMLGERGGGE
ncbi:hypothetical protein GFER_06070 [Geoalkalibacter ferrihydriticus DSM 17813]|uniref:Rod shape-determining protein MreB n=2 Tax=Geoalkalibacter ferrihydriticus TaxID=392333 RepID=A0A0C2DXH8_9BACT|nr:hypothetical protein GFER_06070 [Geoalkalibacter ferrihydriticus DSM 17813]